MLRNYLVTALRSFWRNKIDSLINVTGLALGICCCILIALFLRDEWTFDHFHSKATSIYRGYVKENYGENQQFFNTVTPFPLAETLKNNFAEVESAVRIHPMDGEVRIAGQQFNENVTITDKDFFHVFDFRAIAGSTESVLTDPANVVLTRRMAEKYFGDPASAINKTISIRLGDNFEDFTVKAVTENVPGNSSIQYDFLVPSANLSRLYSEQLLNSAWFNVLPETYVLLKPGTDPAALMQKFPPLWKSILGDDYQKSNYFVGLQPLTDIHLDKEFPAGIAPVNNPQYSYILAAVAALILFLACINFVTLSVGRTLTRAKEVGIRKVVGAVRNQIISQFIGEAMLITLAALLVGFAVASMCLPAFNDIASKSLALEVTPFTIEICAGLLLVIGLMAGSYPAFFLSGFRPVMILKGKLQGNNSQTLRKILVGIQLVFSIFFVSSALIMMNQLEYLQNKDLGFHKDQTLVLQLTPPQPGAGLRDRLKSTFERAQLFKNEFARIPTVRSVCAASHDFGNGSWVEVGYTDEKGTYRTFSVNVIDEVFIPNMGIRIVEGRNFSGNEADARRGIIVNESFVREYGWTSPVGQRIPGKGFPDHEIIGVVKDFNYASLYTTVKPLVLTMNMPVVLEGIENISFDNSPTPKLFLKLASENIEQSIKDIEGVWKRLVPGDDFAFSFIDQAMEKQYRSDQNLARIVQIATVLSMVIGGLGLYALASLTMQSRVREISIRKVLGATAESLFVILSRDYVMIIVISLLVSIPFTIIFMRKWLESFEYRIAVTWEVFALAGMIALLTGLLTITYHAIRLMRAQPGETLKSE